MSVRPVALVTGANKGIGFQIAKDLFAKGYSVVLGCRDVGKGRAAMTAIAKPYEDEIMGENHKLSVIKLDLDDAASIPAAVEEFKRYQDRLDVLVNNAGVYNADPKICLGVNYYATIAVTEAFLPLLAAPKAEKTTNARIVVVSSRMGKLGDAKIQGDALAALSAETVDLAKVTALADAYCAGEEKTGFPFPIVNPYPVSKALISAYTRGLAQRLEKAETAVKVTANATCPGYTKTDMTNNMGMKSVEQGAETIVWAATDAAFEGVSGKFFADHKEGSFF